MKLSPEVKNSMRERAIELLDLMLSEGYSPAVIVALSISAHPSMDNSEVVAVLRHAADMTERHEADVRASEFN